MIWRRNHRFDMRTSEKKLALVTGGSRGIGNAIARSLLANGYEVACTYNRNRRGATELEQEHMDALAVAMDVRSRTSVKRALRAIQRRFKHSIDIVVNNAGISDERPFETIHDGQWDAVLETNLRGAFIVTQETITAMRKQRWGRIINIVSIGGQWGGLRQVHYAASKAGLINFTHSIAKLYSRDGITSNAIAPGLVFTDMIRKELASKDGKKKLASIPTGRITKPEEIAAAALFLVSDDASSITGQTLNINGGLLFS